MKQESPIRQFLSTSGLGRWGLTVTVLLVLMAVLAPWLAPRDPAAQSLPERLRPPGAQHWLGTDELGRDVLSRTLYGARVSLLVGVSVVLGAGVVGLALGSLAGYFGGAFDRFVNIILINSFLSFPGILLAIAFAAFLGPGLDKVILALTVTGWAGYARLARAQVLKVREMEFILAARSLGASHARILLRHFAAPFAAEHSSASPDPGDDWHGGGDSGGVHIEFSRAWRDCADAELGLHAQ